MEELTNYEKRVHNFMLNSRRINGTAIVPPWMHKDAKQVERKLKVIDNRSTEDTPCDISLNKTSR